MNLFLGIERIQCFEVVFWGVNLFSDMTLEEGVFFQKMLISWVVYLDDSDDVTLGSIIHISYGSIVFVFCVDFQLCLALLWVIQSKGKGRGKVNYIWIFIYTFFLCIYIYIGIFLCIYLCIFFIKLNLFLFRNCSFIFNFALETKLREFKKKKARWYESIPLLLREEMTNIL